MLTLSPKWTDQLHRLFFFYYSLLRIGDYTMIKFLTDAVGIPSQIRVERMNLCLWTTWVLVLWLAMATRCDSAVKKARRCVEYEILNYRRHELFLQQHVSLSRDHCMFKCARHPSCAAINVRINGTGCELLQTASTCQVTNYVQGWVLISFPICDGVPPWLTIRPADSGWQWITADDPFNEEGLIYTIDWVAHRFVSRVLYRGLYLPGWWRNDAERFRTIDPFTNTMVKCVSNGQFISFTGATNYTWVDFTSGDDVPDSAIIGGFGYDATPLYVVQKEFPGSILIIGYYNPMLRASYMAYSGLQQSANVAMLLHVWKIVYHWANYSTLRDYRINKILSPLFKDSKIQNRFITSHQTQ